MLGREVVNGQLVIAPVKANTVINEACLIVLDSDGVASEATKAAGLTAIGMSQEYVDNTNGSNGDCQVKVKRGVFVWNNDSGENSVKSTDIFKECYIKDSKTVTMDSEGSSVAGKVIGIEDGIVKVETI